MGEEKERRKEKVKRVPAWYWWLLIIGGMTHLTMMCFYYKPLPYNPFFFLSHDELIVKLIMKVILLLAILAHMGEGYYALVLSTQIRSRYSIFWFFQTLLLGFPSLKLLFEEARLHKQSLHQSNQSNKSD